MTIRRVEGGVSREGRDAMIAASDARKSTEHAGVADDQKSVSRQIEHARQYATRKGWRSRRCG